MKKLVIAALVVVAVLAFCAPAFAWPVALKWWQPSHHFTCVGKIQAVDTTAGTVTVRVHLASRDAADYLGDDLTVVASGAKVFKDYGAGLQSITLADLVVGEKLRVEGVVDYSTATAVFQAKRMVMRPYPIDQIKRFAFRGPVTAVDATARTLTANMVMVTRALSPYYDGSCSFVVAPDVRVWVMKGGWPVKASLADVVVGDRVYAQGGADRQRSFGAGVHHPLDGRASRSRSHHALIRPAEAGGIAARLSLLRPPAAGQRRTRPCRRRALWRCAVPPPGTSAPRARRRSCC